MILKIIFIFLFLFGFSDGQDVFNCQDQKHSICLSSLTQKDCPYGEYLVAHKTPECCPGCQGGILATETCYPDDECAPGLKCDEYACVLDKSTCSYTYHLTDLNIRSLPTCEVDGTFAAVQCNGDRINGRCFCYSETGNRISGWSWWREAQNMTCACSRLKYHLENQIEHDENTLHCNEKGNFEALQCTNGICWCANETTGEMLHHTRAVPESMWTYLPCYDMNEMGLRYLRQCESAAFAQNQLRNTLNVHGTVHVEFNKIHCDYDGAYGIYYNLNGIASCQWRDGTKIGSYQVKSSLVSQMNCNCARDQKLFTEVGLNHRLSCGQNGNYESIQDINGKVFCVDRDGFAVNDAIETEIEPNCTQYIYYEVNLEPQIMNYDDYILNNDNDYV